MTWHTRLVVVTVAVLFPAQPLLAQSGEDARRIEEQARLALSPTEQDILTREKRFVVDYGIWSNHLFSDFKDDDNNANAEDATDATYAWDNRFWLRATWRPPADGTDQHEQSVYLRVKDKLTWRDPPDANGRQDHDGPHLDYLYASLDLRPLWLQAGRRMFSVGQGIAYSNVNDGVELLAAFPAWSLMGFVSRTLPHEDNVDLSLPGGKKSGRTFYAIEGKYLGIRNHGVYGYVLFQQDDADESPEDPVQDFEYESTYFAVGSEGKLFANLRYASEWILETGEHFVSGADRQESIRAWALDLSATYDVQWPTQPTLTAQYAFGSGDSDRASVTDTIAGNSSGRDTNFLYFGYLPTGYALSPRLSNLRMFKVAGSLKPLERVSVLNLKELTIGVDVYWYLKDEPVGGVFDPQASQSDRDVGSEIDLTLSWPILSDLSVAVEFGHFEPGKSYPAGRNDATQYASLSVTTTF